MTSVITVSELLPQSSFEVINLDEQKSLMGGLFNSSAEVDNSTSYETTSNQHIEGDVNAPAFSIGGDVNFNGQSFAEILALFSGGLPPIQ